MGFSCVEVVRLSSTMREKGTFMSTSRIPQGIVAISLDGEQILANGNVIGVTKEHYNDLLDKYEEYEGMLIDAGIIEPELSQEEVLEQTKEALAKSNAALEKSNALTEKLMARLDALEQQGDSNVQKNPIPSSTTAKKRNDGNSKPDNGLSAPSNGNNELKGNDG